MNHSDCQDLVGPLLDGELDPERARLVAAHVDRCGDCRARRDAMAALSRGIRSLERLPMPEDLKVSLRAAAASGSAPPDRTWGLMARPWAAASLAAAALLVVMGILSLRPDPTRVTSLAEPGKDRGAAHADDASGLGAPAEREAYRRPLPDNERAEQAPGETAITPQAKTRDARDEIAKRRVSHSKPSEEAQKPSATPVTVERGKLAPFSRQDQGQERPQAPGYLAGNEPVAAAPSFAPVEGEVLMGAKELAGIPAGSFVTTLMVSGDAVSFAPLEPRPGGRTRLDGKDGRGIAWRIQTPGFSLREEPTRAVPAPAAETASGAGLRSAALEQEKADPDSDAARILALRSGPEQTMVILVSVDERGLIVEADPVGASTVGPEIAAAVTRLLEGSSLVPYTAGRPARLSFEITLLSTGQSR